MRLLEGREADGVARQAEAMDAAAVLKLLPQKELFGVEKTVRCVGGMGDHFDSWRWTRSCR